MSNTNLALVTSHFPQKMRQIGDRKRKFMKLKVIYSHNLFCILKHIHKTLCVMEYTMQHLNMFLSTQKRECVCFCVKSLPS